MSKSACKIYLHGKSFEDDFGLFKQNWHFDFTIINWMCFCDGSSSAN